MAEERNLWIRLGAMLRITVEEEAAIFAATQHRHMRH